MTTIKEYKAMIEGATDGPWEVVQPDEEIRSLTIRSGEWIVCEMCCCIDGDDVGDIHANLIAASRNIAPELIRVIELAEDALVYAHTQMQPFCDDSVVKNALSEIRKFNGE